MKANQGFVQRGNAKYHTVRSATKPRILLVTRTRATSDSGDYALKAF